jgi:hypothetical protein
MGVRRICFSEGDAHEDKSAAVTGAAGLEVVALAAEIEECVAVQEFLGGAEGVLRVCSVGRGPGGICAAGALAGGHGASC